MADTDIANMTDEESFAEGVFPYFAEGTWQTIDPLEVWNRIYAACPDFDALADRFFGALAPVAIPGEDQEPASSVEPEDPAAASRRGVELIQAAVALAPAVRAGFEVSALGRDKKGVSTSKAIELLTSLMAWQDRRDTARQAAELEHHAAAAEAEAKARAEAEAKLLGLAEVA